MPSDLQGYWFLTYGLRPAEVAKFKTDVKRLVAAFEEQRDRSDSPVSDYLDREQLSSSRQVNRDNVKKLGALMTELSGNRLALRQHLDTYKPQVFSLGCLGLLIETLYVDVGTDVLKLCYELEYKLQLLQKDIYPEQVVTEALALTETLAQKIGEIRNKITKGEFTEPATVSTMIWSPRETIAEQLPDDSEQYNYSYLGPAPECHACNGTGKTVCQTCAGRGCAACLETGSLDCPDCQGVGSSGAA